MFSAAFTEWLPALGESWQTVQVPVNDAGGFTPLENVSSLSPATPLIVNWGLSEMCCPRRTARRLSVTGAPGTSGRPDHASKRMNALGSNAAPEGFSPIG